MVFLQLDHSGGKTDLTPPGEPAIGSLPSRRRAAVRRLAAGILPLRQAPGAGADAGQPGGHPAAGVQGDGEEICVPFPPPRTAISRAGTKRRPSFCLTIHPIAGIFFKKVQKN